MSEDRRLKSCRLALPEGAQPAGFSFDAERQQWVLFVQHESFDEIPEGETIPEMLAADFSQGHPGTWQALAAEHQAKVSEWIAKRARATEKAETDARL